MAAIITAPVRGACWEDGTLICLARLVGEARTPITQSSVAAPTGSITRKVFDITGETPDTPITAGTATMVIASTIYNTLQTDARWTKDATGYNFKDLVPASVFAEGDHTYIVEYRIVDTNGYVGWLVFEQTAVAVRTS